MKNTGFLKKSTLVTILAIISFTAVLFTSCTTQNQTTVPASTTPVYTTTAKTTTPPPDTSTSTSALNPTSESGQPFRYLVALFLFADQGDAEIYIDNEYEGKTASNGFAPVLTVHDGLLTIKLSKPGYKDWEKRVNVIYGGAELNIFAYLESGTGAATTRSETITTGTDHGYFLMYTSPGDANIYVDEEYGGTSSTGSGQVTVNGLYAGTYNVRVSKPGYKDWVKKVTIANDHRTLAYAYLESGTGAETVRNEIIQPVTDPGKVIMYTNPGGADVYVDEEYGGTSYAGNGQIFIDGIFTGTYGLRISKPGYKDWVKKVTITNKKRTTIYAYLESGTGAGITRDEIIPSGVKPGTLLMYTTPGGADVYVDEEYGGTSYDGNGQIFIDGIFAGTYTVRVSKPGYRDWVGEVTITNEKRTRIDPTLTP